MAEWRGEDPWDAGDHLGERGACVLGFSEQ